MEAVPKSDIKSVIKSDISIKRTTRIGHISSLDQKIPLNLVISRNSFRRFTKTKSRIGFFIRFQSRVVFLQIDIIFGMLSVYYSYFT